MTLQVEDPTQSNTDQTLLDIERRLDEQADETQKLRKNVVFFGGMFTLMAILSLVAVAAKLGTKDINVTTTAAAPKAQAPSAPTAAAPASAAGLPSATSVVLKEFKVLSTKSTLGAGKVSFNVRNTGSVTHEFVVLKTKFPAAKLPLSKGRADESGNVGETGDLKPGASKNLK